MKWIINIVCIMCFELVFAQERLENFIESRMVLSVEEDQELYLADILQAYKHIRFTISDIHKPIKWKSFFFLNQNELQQIYRYLKTFPEEQSIAFLNQLNGFSKDKAYLIRYKVLTQTGFRKNIQKLKMNGSVYTYIPNVQTFNAFKNRNRIQLSNGPFKWFLQSEKDVKESSVSDYISGGFTFRIKKNRWFFGDYIAQFGTGMSFFQGYQAFNFYQLNQSLPTRFKIHTGTNENAYLRGVALETTLREDWKINGFLSAKPTDARYTDKGVTNLFVDGTHDSHTALNFKKSIQITSIGGALTKRYNHFTTTSLGYWNHFSKPIISYSGIYRNQYSLSQTMAYFTPQFHINMELNLDQGHYFSQLTKIQSHLGKAFYLGLFYGVENPHFKNYFRQLPLLFSFPEKVYGYQVEQFRKQIHLLFSYQHSKGQKLNTYHEKQVFRLNMVVKLKAKARLQVSSVLKESRRIRNLTQSSKSIVRNQIVLQVKLRGLWNWQQRFLFKWGHERGMAFSSRFEYKKPRWSLKWGIIQFQQTSGAMYIYESDIQALGYVKGFFNSGNLCYALVQINRNQLSFYGKLRVLNVSNEHKVGVSLGFKFKL